MCQETIDTDDACGRMRGCACFDLVSYGVRVVGIGTVAFAIPAIRFNLQTPTAVQAYLNGREGSYTHREREF